jgi:SAM-dependent methyltransferase
LDWLKRLFGGGKEPAQPAEQIASRDWVSDAGGLRARRYDGYQQYRAHQAAKRATILKLSAYHNKFRIVLRNRLQFPFIDHLAGASVLCLGARTGAECEAFIDRGLKPIGIDINPDPDAPLVKQGDFNNLDFPDGSFDVVYTNSLDHAFDLDKVIGEIWRVLKPGRHFIAEIVLGSKDGPLGREPGDYESLWWDHAGEVAERIERRGFTRMQVSQFDYPWNGRQYVFVKRDLTPGSAA